MKIARLDWLNFEKNAAFLKTIFPADSIRYYYAFYHFDPYFEPSRIVSVIEGGEVVSTLWSLPRLFHDGDRFLRAAGIANVGTAEKARGRGLASCLMDEGMRQAEMSGDDFAVLVTDIPGFYSRWGFRDLGKYYTDIPPHPPVQGFRVGRAEGGEILKASSNFYRRTGLTVPLRNPVSIRALEERNRWSSLFTAGENRPGWITVEAAGARLYAYRTYRGERVDVHEFFWEEETKTEDVVKLLSLLGAASAKPVRVFQHPDILTDVGLLPVKDKEAVMCARLSTRDTGRIHLPQPEYF